LGSCLCISLWLCTCIPCLWWQNCYRKKNQKKNEIGRLTTVSLSAAAPSRCSIY